MRVAALSIPHETVKVPFSSDLLAKNNGTYEQFHNNGRTFWTKFYSLSSVPGKPSVWPVTFAVLYRYLLDKAVHRTRKFCSVACSCLEKAVQKLVTDVHLVCLHVESPNSIY